MRFAQSTATTGESPSPKDPQAFLLSDVVVRRDLQVSAGEPSEAQAKYICRCSQTDTFTLELKKINSRVSLDC